MTQIGAIYPTIDWDDLVKLLPVKTFILRSNIFATKLSDEKLFERFNTD
jgi:hypothetical protein